MPSTEISRKLRRDQTAAERKFWEILYPFRQAGWHFRRQCPVGDYVVDFVCKRARLVFEIDGDSHYLEASLVKDAMRTAYLASRGYRVIRFTNPEVLDNADGIFLRVMQVLGDPSTPS